MPSYKILNKEWECPIAASFLAGIAIELSSDENELMYENKRHELLELQSLAAVAGKELAVQHLRGFVVLELLVLLFTRATVFTTVNSGADSIGLRTLLGRRTGGCLTNFIQWIDAQLSECEADRIFYGHYHGGATSPHTVHMLANSMTLYRTCREAAELLRRGLKNHELSLGGLGSLLTEGCDVANLDITTRLNFARKIINVTHEKAPRGWEK